MRAAWINILQHPTQSEQPNPSQANYNPVIGRYAYWVEDETSKLDASLVGNQESSGAFRRGDGVDDAASSPPRRATNDLDVGALPLVAGPPPTALPPGDIPTNRAILDLRATLPMADARFLNRIGGQVSSTVHETTKFYSTVFSLSNDLAANGRRRANINALVTSPASPTVAVPAGTIASNLDDIAYVISGNHLIPAGLTPPPTPDLRVYKDAPGNYAGAMPTFGTRFFSPAPTPDQQRMYLERVAANIRDYIDSDQQPTYIDAAEQVQSGSRITTAWTSGTEPRAVGKEAIPYLQEHGWAGFEVSMSGTSATTPRDYQVRLDHYLEFYNPTTKDFIAPPGTLIRIYNRPQWDAGSFPPLQPPDLQLDVSGQTFPAGRATVITSMPAGNDPPGLLLNPGNVIRISTSSSQRVFAGRTDKQISSNRGFTGTPRPFGLQVVGRSGSGGVSDYATAFVWGTSAGIFDAHAFLGFGGGNASNPRITWDYAGVDVGDNKRFVYTASLRGNDQASRTGDSRTLSEQLQMLGGVTSLGNDQTRFFGNIDGDKQIPGTATFGRAAISFVDPTKWPDFNPALADTAPTAHAVVRDEAMRSIGELGQIYDPHRVIAATGNPAPTILQARGGGRTLKVGQVDELAAARFSTNWFNAAWRLADLFAARPVANAAQPQAYEFVAPPTSRGRLNINGVLRDGGTAFRAALRSYSFLAAPDSDPQLNGQPFPPAQIDALVTALQNYLTNIGPMMERGELSQLPFFNTGTGTGKPGPTTSDRGREEIFRRVVEMITTRSASFTVYAIGETVRQDANGMMTTTGQKRLAQTFYLEPLVNGAPLASSNVPHDVVTSYRVKKIYAPQ
jgi:hypothetical protein